ncbi:unnamed protein product [Pleuronectes platessa]|uniref:Uncharacterized protein n=1 Tax=Pleuronectes platessa TaxID=8262 RepID=A0A9N7V944_PLEPL|nr:unnamed protein product [Pleuronectes platessa]
MALLLRCMHEHLVELEFRNITGARISSHQPPLALTVVQQGSRPGRHKRKKITLTVGSQLSYKKIYNVVGYLKGRRNPDRYVLVGSRHDSDQRGGASAIMNQLIAALTEQTKLGWVPDRTTVFCSWGGSALGNIGSYEWGKDNSVVLQSSAVAYVSLNSPVRGTETLRAAASPTLLQLTSDIQRRRWTSGRNLDYGQKRSLVRLWFDSTEKQQKDEPGLICSKIQEDCPYPV